MVSSERNTVYWPVLQPTGASKTTDCSDFNTPWSPGSWDFDPEWIDLIYEIPVYANGVRVHETQNFGLIYQVDLIDVRGELHTTWSGTHTTSCAGQLELNFPQTHYLVSRVRIYMQAIRWEEIDAVELIGSPGPSLKLTLTGCTVCQPGDPFSVDIRLINPSFESKPVEAKIGIRLPGGAPQNLFGKNLELVLPAETDQTISSVFSMVLPSGMTVGEWHFEGALLEPELGETYSRDSKPFTVTVGP